MKIKFEKLSGTWVATTKGTKEDGMASTKLMAAKHLICNMLQAKADKQQRRALKKQMKKQARLIEAAKKPEGHAHGPV